MTTQKKYKLLKNDTKKTPDGKTLLRIQALIDFSIFKKGEKGGYIEKEDNLSQEGDAWVSEDARVYGDAQVYGDARVYGNAWVYGDAWVSGDARVYGNAQVYGDARVYWNAQVYGNARVFGDAWVYGRFDLTVSIDYELPRIVIDTDKKLKKLKEFLETF